MRLPLVIILSVPLMVGQIAVRNQGYVPFSDAPIYYRTAPVRDPVALLQQRLDRGDTQLQYEAPHGYLKSVLKLLDIPLSSQTLVFSKTSFQFRRITPHTPRALYFNDDVYVGWVKEGKLEVVSFDPNQGAIFYIVENQPSQKPRFERAELDCTQCHVAAATRGVPGVFVRSVHTSPSGAQSARGGSFLTGHESPITDRFGGWFVTGTHGRIRHMGNVTVDRSAEDSALLNRDAGANLTDLAERIDRSLYLTANSDIVAQLVQAHQTQLHNLITLTNYRTRLAIHAETERNRALGAPQGPLSEEARRQYEKPAEELVRYLLFADEAPLEDVVSGNTTFTEDFAAKGPRDAQGRSLRDFDLKTRLFRYPCSYLIYSEAFDNLPAPAKSYVYQRLNEVLTGKDQTPAFARLSTADRQAIFEILLQTKRGLPQQWTAAPERAPEQTAASKTQSQIHSHQ